MDLNILCASMSILVSFDQNKKNFHHPNSLPTKVGERIFLYIEMYYEIGSSS